MKPEQIRTINTIVEHLPQCNCKLPSHDDGCIVPMLLDLHRQANETRHTITILKRDTDMEVARRLAEEELTAIYGPYTDHTIKIEQKELKELFAIDAIQKAYLIRITANLTDEEVADIRQRQYERECRLLANIGQVKIDEEDIGRAYKEFF